MFKNVFSFKGRIRRTEYAVSLIIYVILAIGIYVIGINYELFALTYIPLLWFLWAQNAKRCHDRSNSGWFQIIPFYGLWMLFGDSYNGINEYGPNPKGINNFEPTDNI